MLYYIVVVLAYVIWRIGFRVSVRGKENLIQGRGFIMAPNHLSAIDPVFVVITGYWTHKMRVFAKGELFQGNKLLEWFLSGIGCVPVKKGRDDLATVNRTIEEVKAGRGLLIFPEGTRSKTGQVGMLKSGLFVIAAQAGVDVIPCRIIYGTESGFMKLFCRVRVCYGEPIPASAFALEDGKRNLRQMKENKQRLLKAWEDLYEANKFA